MPGTEDPRQQTFSDESSHMFSRAAVCRSRNTSNSLESVCFPFSPVCSLLSLFWSLNLRETVCSTGARFSRCWPPLACATGWPPASLPFSFSLQRGFSVCRLVSCPESAVAAMSSVRVAVRCRPFNSRSEHTGQAEAHNKHAASTDAPTRATPRLAHLPKRRKAVHLTSRVACQGTLAARSHSEAVSVSSDLSRPSPRPSPPVRFVVRLLMNLVCWSCWFCLSVCLSWL